MFFDRWEFELVKLDNAAVEKKDASRVVFWSTGFVELMNPDRSAPTKADVLTSVGMLGRHYAITPEEFAAAVEKAKVDLAVRVKRGVVVDADGRVVDPKAKP